MSLAIGIGSTKPMPRGPPPMLIPLLGQLLGLACVCSLALQVEGNLGGAGKPKRPCDCQQVEPMYVVHVFELVAVVREDVGAIGLSCTLVEVVVFLHEALQLGLHICDLVCGEFILVQGDLCVGGLLLHTHVITQVGL